MASIKEAILAHVVDPDPANTISEAIAQLADVYTKVETDDLLDLKADAADVYTKEEIDELPLATATVVANQADSTATEVAELLADFNGLLAKLQAAGIMADGS